MEVLGPCGVVAMSEIWKSVVGFEGLYEVSDLGRVRSLGRPRSDGRHQLRGRLLKHFASHNGYLYVDVRRDNQTHRLPVGHTVLMAFRGVPQPRHEVAHLDGVRGNNMFSNLAWKTHAENCADKVAHGTDFRGEKCPTAKLTSKMVTRIRALCAAGEPQAKTGRAFGISQTQVSRIANGLRWAHV